jgi:peroxiredoxin
MLVAGWSCGPLALAEPAGEAAPREHTAFYRLDASAARIAPVLLSQAHAALTKVKVGDTLPPIELPQLGQNASTKLAKLYGKTATVVLFWKGDRRMSHTALADLTPDVIEPFGDEGVAAVGIAVGETAATASAAAKKAGAKFPHLLDVEGEAFAQIGSERLPRIFLVDPKGKILWFDMEYSQASRRELHQALRAVTGEK